jgi:hypothetical protein
VNIKGRESVNSFDDSSVRNSQSGAIDGIPANTNNNTNNANKLTKLSYLNNSTLNTLNGSTNLNTNGVNINTGSNSNNLMSSTDTISRNQRETLHSRFDFVKVLGKGTYGKVKLANDKRTGKQVITLH